jgi:WD40 repeat protein
VASGDREHHIEIWDIETGRVLHRMSAEHAAEVRGVEFLGDDRLVSVATDRKVVLWSPFGGRRVSTSLAAPDGRAVAFDDVNSTVVSAGGGIDPTAPYASNVVLPGFVESTPIGSATEGPLVETSSPVYALDARDGVIAVGMLDGSVELHDLGGAGLLRRWERSELECPGDGENGVRALSFGDESGAVAVGFFDGTMLVIDDPLADAGIRCERADGPVWDLAFRPGGDQVVGSNGDDHIVVWSLDDDTTTTVPIGTEVVRSVAFDADGSRLATGSSDGDVVVLDTDGFARIGQPFSVHGAAVLDLAFHPDRSILASASADETVVLWNLRTGLALTDPPIGMDALIRSIAWLPDGDGFVVASTDDVEVWDTREPVLVDAVCEAVGRDLTRYERRAFVDESRGTTCDDRS